VKREFISGIAHHAGCRQVEASVTHSFAASACAKNAGTSLLDNRSAAQPDHTFGPPGQFGIV
jgi:hypothetical protein